MKLAKFIRRILQTLVPLILMSDTLKTATLEAGKLCDIAPTLLDLAGIEQPESMTGHSLVQKA